MKNDKISIKIESVDTIKFWLFSENKSNFLQWQAKNPPHIWTDNAAEGRPEFLEEKYKEICHFSF